MFSIFFWISVFLILVGVFVPDNQMPLGVRGRGLFLIALILLGLTVYPFHR